MGYSAMIEAIKTRVDTELGGTYQIQHDNALGFEKPDNTVWIRASIRPAGGETVCISAKNTYRLSGILDLAVFGPLGSNEQDVNDAVELAIKAFDYARINVGDAEGTIVKFDAAPYPTVVGRNSGEYQVNVTQPWRADFIQT